MTGAVGGGPLRRLPGLLRRPLRFVVRAFGIYGLVSSPATPPGWFETVVCRECGRWADAECGRVPDWYDDLDPLWAQDLDKLQVPDHQPPVPCPRGHRPHPGIPLWHPER